LEQGRQPFVADVGTFLEKFLYRLPVQSAPSLRRRPMPQTLDKPDIGTFFAKKLPTIFFDL
jgi:hypothetical protein